MLDYMSTKYNIGRQRTEIKGHFGAGNTHPPVSEYMYMQCVCKRDNASIFNFHIHKN